jgi:hypothetical protein
MKKKRLSIGLVALTLSLGLIALGVACNASASSLNEARVFVAAAPSAEECEGGGAW